MCEYLCEHRIEWSVQMHIGMSLIRITANMSFILTHFLSFQLKETSKAQRTMNARIRTEHTNAFFYATLYHCVVFSVNRSENPNRKLAQVYYLWIDFDSKCVCSFYLFFRSIALCAVCRHQCESTTFSSTKRLFSCASAKREYARDAHKRCVRSFGKLFALFSGRLILVFFNGDGLESWEL